MKLDQAIDDLQHAESDLARELRVLAEHHATEHDVYHLGHSRADVCREHIMRLRPFVERYGFHEVEPDDASTPGFVDAVRRRAAEALGRAEVAGVMLLRDLRDAYVTAQRVEIEWIIVEQATKAVRDGELLKVVMSCHEEAEQTAKWLRTRIKLGAAQVLATN